MSMTGRGKGMVAYNVQAAVDTEHHLVIAYEVLNAGADCAQLVPMGAFWMLSALTSFGAGEGGPLHTA
jgi:hypothetical protein